MKVRSTPAKDFKLIFDKGNFYRSQNFNLKTLHLTDDTESVFFGAIVSKKKDKLAVHRNRTRRVLREALRQSSLEGLGGTAFVFIPHESGMGKSLVEYLGEIREILNVIKK